MKTFFLINCLLIAELSFADPGRQESKENLPVLVISRDQIDKMGNVKVAQLLMFMNAKLPVFRENTTHSEFIDLINKTDNQIIDDTGDMILVQSFSKNEETGENQPIFRTQYFFNDGILSSGPVLEINEEINGIKIISDKLNEK